MKDRRLGNVVDVLGLCIDRLSESVATPPVDQRDLAGIVKHFEMTFEQSYKCLLELLIVLEDEDSRRSVKAVFRRAFEFGWITDEQAFMAMIRDRNATSHTYDSDFAISLVERVSDTYLPLFLDLQKTLAALTQVEEGDSASHGL
jgi:nucleotidyltransferase substrate binding protein (TIGR01987 family)